MMPRTRNYAKLGQVTWRAQVGLDDGFEPHARTIAEREFRSARSKGLARAFVTATLRGLRNPPAVSADSGAFDCLCDAALPRLRSFGLGDPLQCGPLG